MLSTQAPPLIIENALQSNCCENFRSLMIATCEREKGNFIWGTNYYCVDLNGNIFWSYSNSSYDFYEKKAFPSGAKATFLPSVAVDHYNIDGPVHIGEDITDAYELENYLAAKGIKKIPHPTIPHDYNRELLKNEILNSWEFIKYLIINSCKNVYNSSCEELYNKVSRQIDCYIERADRSFLKDNCELTSLPSSLKKGDLLIFNQSVHQGTRFKCRHMGIYYGLNEKNCPLVFDLWTRDGSESAKVVSFTECEDYKKYSFSIIPLSLDAIYLELDQQLGLSKAISDREAAKHLSTLGIVGTLSNLKQQPDVDTKPKNSGNNNPQDLDSKFSSLTIDTFAEILKRIENENTQQANKQLYDDAELADRMLLLSATGKLLGVADNFGLLIKKYQKQFDPKNYRGLSFGESSYIHLTAQDRIGLALYWCLTAIKYQGPYSLKIMLIQAIFGFPFTSKEKEYENQLARVKNFLNKKFHFEKTKKQNNEEYELSRVNSEEEKISYQINMLRNLVSFYLLESRDNLDNSMIQINSPISWQFIHQIQFILAQTNINDLEKVTICNNLTAAFLIVKPSGRARDLLRKFDLEKSTHCIPDGIKNNVKSMFKKYRADYFTPLFENQSDLQYCLAVVAVLSNYNDNKFFNTLAYSSGSSAQLFCDLLVILNNEKSSFIEKAQQAKKAINMYPEVGKRLTGLLAQSKLITDGRANNSSLISSKKDSIQMQSFTEKPHR